MKAETCAAMIRDRLQPDDLVICGLGGTEAAMKKVGEAAATYYASDPMGVWPSVALGLALARPAQRVVFLAGDGDLAMNLESLITIGSVAPDNLRIILFQNGRYASAGGQHLAGNGIISFRGIAESCGFSWAAEAHEEEAFGTRLDQIFALKTLGFLAAHLEDVTAPFTPPGIWSQVEEKAFFMKRIGST